MSSFGNLKYAPVTKREGTCKVLCSSEHRGTPPAVTGIPGNNQELLSAFCLNFVLCRTAAGQKSPAAGRFSFSCSELARTPAAGIQPPSTPP